MSTTAGGSAAAHDAAVQTGPPSDPVIEYLTTRVDEIQEGIETAEEVAAGAKQTAATLREELKKAKADLKAARAGQGN
jgi:prefoldin subunit 5